MEAERGQRARMQRTALRLSRAGLSPSSSLSSSRLFSRRNCSSGLSGLLRRCPSPATPDPTDARALGAELERRSAMSRETPTMASIAAAEAERCAAGLLDSERCTGRARRCGVRADGVTPPPRCDPAPGVDSAGGTVDTEGDGTATGCDGLRSGMCDGDESVGATGGATSGCPNRFTGLNGIAARSTPSWGSLTPLRVCNRTQHTAHSTQHTARDIQGQTLNASCGAHKHRLRRCQADNHDAR